MGPSVDSILPLGPALQKSSDGSPGDSHPGDSSPLRGFLDGDSESVSRIAAIARRVVGDRAYFIPEADRQDLVQECLVQLYRTCGRPGFRLEESMEALVRAVAYRRCVDWMRRRRPTVEFNPDTADRSRGPERELADKETIERGRRVLERLGKKCHEIIRMRAIDGMSYRQVAERLGRSEGAARNIMYRCLQEARRILDAAGERG